MEFQGFTLKGEGDTLEHVIGLVEDLASGRFKIRVETYDGGSPLVVEYPDLITLD